jgi:hypothetical protein
MSTTDDHNTARCPPVSTARTLAILSTTLSLPDPKMSEADSGSNRPHRTAEERDPDHRRCAVSYMGQAVEMIGTNQGVGAASTSGSSLCHAAPW